MVIPGCFDIPDLGKNSSAMMIKKCEFILGFIKYIIRLLEKSLPEDGYEGELWDKAINEITRNKSHIDSALKWPGNNQ